MKLLIVANLETIKKSVIQVSGLRMLTKAHLKKIRTIAPQMEIAVTGDPNEIAQHVADAEIIVTSPRTLPPLANARNLKWLHSLSAGVDRLLTPEIKRSSVLVSNSSGVHAIPIAEHVMTYMLIFARGFLGSLENQRKRVWKRGEGLIELYDKTVLIVGMGHIGSEVARRAHAFGCHVIALTRSGKTDSTFIHVIHRASALTRMLPKADFVISCLPGTPETHHIFDFGKFRLMKPSAYFINIGRGALVHEKDLITALEKKLIAGAALDVTEVEPLPVESPLWNLPNVIITPHHSGSSERYIDRAVDRFCLNLQAYLAHKPLPNLVDKKLGY